MDRKGFRELLKTRKLNEEQIEASVAIAERFEDYLNTAGETTSGAAARKFSNILLHEGHNSYENFLALARYGLFIKDNEVYVAIVELLDGAEAQPNLYKKVEERFGEGVRDEVFAEIGVSPIGLPSTEKPFYMFPVLDRLVNRVGYEPTERLLSGCLRDLPDEDFREEREVYLKSIDIDDYLKNIHQKFVEQLQKCQQEGRLFFSQEITDEVVEYVKARPETECGVRQGNIVYITKIPYNAVHYLTETNPTLKRYYACHCPWAREEIKNGNIPLNPIFCNCSGGFSKKPWEVIFGQTLQAEVLESVLKGDYRCRFAIHLPEKMVISSTY
jgi:hypothetical protein